MACERCIATRQKIKNLACRRPLSRACMLATLALEKLTGKPEAPTYQTRMMAAEPVYSRSEPVESAPYGYKADGTPRLRPGRPAKAE